MAGRAKNVERSLRDWWHEFRKQMRPLVSRIPYLLLCLIVSLFLMATMGGGNVSTKHLDLWQRFFDRQAVIETLFNEYLAIRVPTCSLSQKIHLAATTQWTLSESVTGTCSPIPLDVSSLVWALKTPKAASSTLQDIIVELRRKHPERYVVSSRQLRFGDWSEKEELSKAYTEYFSGITRRTVYSAHGWFLDFERWGLPKPVYIGTIREPMARLLSHYDYLQAGPRSAVSLFRHKMPGRVDKAPSFETCVRNYMDGDGSMERVWKCLHWANIQLKYYCGYADECKEAEAPALALATANIRHHFAVVVVVERFAESLKLLEAFLPAFFEGLPEVFAKLGLSRVNEHNKDSSGAGNRGKGLRPATSGGEEQEHRDSRSSSSSSSIAQRNDSLAAGGSTLSPAVRKFVVQMLRHETILYKISEKRLLSQLQLCGFRR